MNNITIERGKNFLKELRRDYSERQVTLFGGLFPEDKDNYPVKYGDCIGPSRSFGPGCIALVHVLYTKKADAACGFKLCNKYWDWLMNESFWSQAFITKDVEEARKLGVILRTDIPGNILMGAAIALRAPWEYFGGDPGINVKVWNKFSRYFSEDLALYLSSEFKFHDEQEKFYCYSPHNTPHWILDPKTMTKADVKRFLNRRVAVERKARDFRNYTRYSPYCAGPERTRITCLFNIASRRFKNNVLKNSYSVQINKALQEEKLFTRIKVNSFYTKDAIKEQHLMAGLDKIFKESGLI